MNIELICVIVNSGHAARIVNKAKAYGVLGNTVALGRGTVKKRFLDFFNIIDIRKEIIFMLAERTVAYDVLEKIDKKFEFGRPNHGIAFITKVAGAMGSRCYRCGEEVWEHVAKEEEIMHYLVTAIVDKGRAEDVVDAAIKVGANGGTVINSRGAGIHETQKVFAIDIEPEKEIIMIIAKSEIVKDIVDSIKKELKMEIPGNGIVYVQEVNKVYGLHQSK